LCVGGEKNKTKHLYALQPWSIKSSGLFAGVAWQLST